MNSSPNENDLPPNQKDLEEKARKIWKIFGRNTHAGRILHQVYHLPRAIKIDYPKPKPKLSKPDEESTKKPAKPCPQKTKIEYPAVKTNKEEPAKLHLVDLIPKRKNYEEIRKEIDEFYAKPVIPENKGVDRSNLIEKLQKKFKDSRGILPKKAQLPQLQDKENSEFPEEEIKRQALQKISKKQLYFLKKTEKSEAKLEKTDEKQELRQMYDEIIAEMEERQQFLESIAHLDEPALKEKIKREIIDRVSELQKISEMLRGFPKTH